MVGKRTLDVLKAPYWVRAWPLLNGTVHNPLTGRAIHDRVCFLDIKLCDVHTRSSCCGSIQVRRTQCPIELVLIILNLDSLYHFYCLATNTTTIEGWEKDKVATLVRRGKIHEVKFPYVRLNVF